MYNFKIKVSSAMLVLKNEESSNSIFGLGTSTERDKLSGKISAIHKSDL